MTLPGTMTAYSGYTAPGGWLLCDGSIYTSTQYPALFPACTITQTGTITASTTTITGLTSTANMYVFMPVFGLGLTINTQVASIISSTSVSLNTTAYGSGSQSLTFFPYGMPNVGGIGTSTNTSPTITSVAGAILNAAYVGATISMTGFANGTTILSVNVGAATITMSNNATGSNTNAINAYPLGGFAVPNLVGRTPLMQDLSGTVLATAKPGAGQSSGEETHTLITGEMPAHTHAPSFGTAFVTTAAAGSEGLKPTPDVGCSILSITTSSVGGGGSHNNMQPWIAVGSWIIKT